MATLVALTVVLTQSAQGQTFKVIYNFMNGQDGSAPNGDLAINAAGDLYGTDFNGGTHNRGTAFKLGRSSSGWVLTPLYSFGGLGAGSVPWAGVIFGPDGSLYGPAEYGGVGARFCGCGTVYNLKPSASSVGEWTETVIHTFSGKGYDGAQPLGGVAFDQAGNLYGTTGNWGVVYQLKPSSDGWTENIIHRFSGGEDGGGPTGDLIFDQSGNLYGTTQGGGFYNYGTVYELTPSGTGWSENVLYSFRGGDDGFYPFGGLVFDHSGNLYGTTPFGGSRGGGVVFELSPSNGSWTLTVLYSFTGSYGSRASLTRDTAGNLYGTTSSDGLYGLGSVFKLIPSNGGWTYTALRDFTGGSDGQYPNSNLVFDTNGNLYGTANAGGAYGYGVVFEITP